MRAPVPKDRPDPNGSHPYLVVYRDSITHRMLHLLHSYPTQEFTLGQLMAATVTPVPADNKAPAIAPGSTSARQATSRSATSQLTRMLAHGMAVRTLRQTGAGTASQYLYKAGPMGPGYWMMRATAAWRPEDNPGLTD